MHKTLGIAGMLTLALFVACGSDASNEDMQQPLSDAGDESDRRPDDRADADGQPDAAALPDDGGAVTRGFQIKSKSVVIEPSQEITYCFRFMTPNTETLPIKKWKSVMTPGVRFMMLFVGGERGGSDSLSASCPDFKNASASNPPVWAYSSYDAESELVFPSDDGTGKPLGFELPAEKDSYMMIHHVNTTTQPLTAYVMLSAEALPEGAEYTKTSTFLAYNAALAIPGSSTNHVESRACDTLPDTKFWSMGMHAHKQATKLTAKNGTSAGGSVAYETSDWSNPLQKTWASNPFYAFDQGKLSFECTYTNPTNRTIRAGNSFSTDEMCMVTGYYFPATNPALCFCPEGLPGCVNL